MNYIDSIAKDIHFITDGDGLPPLRTVNLFRIYAVLCLTTGIATTSRNVHDAWSAWMAGDDIFHRSLVPFEELTPEVQAMDDEYRDAIRIVAARRAGMVSLDDGTPV